MVPLARFKNKVKESVSEFLVTCSCKWDYIREYLILTSENWRLKEKLTNGIPFNQSERSIDSVMII